MDHQRSHRDKSKWHYGSPRERLAYNCMYFVQDRISEEGKICDDVFFFRESKKCSYNYQKKVLETEQVKIIRPRKKLYVSGTSTDPNFTP